MEIKILLSIHLLYVNVVLGKNVCIDQRIILHESASWKNTFFGILCCAKIVRSPKMARKSLLQLRGVLFLEKGHVFGSLQSSRKVNQMTDMH